MARSGMTKTRLQDHREEQGNREQSPKQEAGLTAFSQKSTTEHSIP